VGSRLYSVVDEVPYLDPFVRAERAGVRRLGELADVAATDVSRSEDRIQYWTFVDLTFVDDDSRMSWLEHDLTILTPNAIGWERSKTYGHVHLGPGEAGFAELYEVLEGRAGILVQDLLPGPSTSVAVLVEAGPGETVVIPPRFHHATINLGSSMLVVEDLVARQAKDDYALVKTARGMSWYIGTDEIRPNPAYESVPLLKRVPAAEWSEPQRTALSATLHEDSLAFGWLTDGDRFVDHFPELWAWLVSATRPPGD
jgi:oxalate decarboxylase/phosphoglucose isomerase-like protein (cupin superfamily)